MPDTNPQETLNTNSSEFRLNRFETAWRSGEPMPRWQDYLPSGEEPCSPQLICDLLQLDIEYRIKAGLPALLAERYFEHPRLQREDARLDAEQQVELIRWEHQQRWQNGQRPRRAEYEAAFPQHAEAVRGLKTQWRCPRCHKLFVPDETLQTQLCPDCDCESPTHVAAPHDVADTPSTQFDLRGYELIEKLGEGGMGEVHRCGDPALGRDLAIKVMKPEYRGHTEAERRFLREARVTGSLQHPGIVPIHNLGRLNDGRLHYTMRLVRGRTFADILREEAGKPERLPYLLTVFEKICQAVAYAHSKRVLHRDLKPPNVMVGRFGEVQVMDWGLAKVLTEEEAAYKPEQKTDAAATHIVADADTPLDFTRMGRGMGTPAYMPPEQALGEWFAVDERADVFALGSILCNILTGQAAYSGTDGKDVLRRAKCGDVAEAQERLQQCGADEALTALCRECLSPHREDRPRDAIAVAERVKSYQAEVQERLRRAEVERAEAQLKTREGRKQRRLLIALVLALLAGASLSIWQAVRATAERDDKEIALGKAVKSEEDTKAVLTFFQNNVLSAGRPRGQEGGLGTDVTLRKAMDSAESKIVTSFADRPLVEASIRNTLGTTYEHLGDYRLAIPQFQRALELREAELGPDHADTLGSRNNLAEAYRKVGRHDEAIPLLEQTLKQMEAKHGIDHRNTLKCRNNLAIAYLYAGRIDESIRLQEQTLQQREAALGLDDPDTLKSCNNLAAAYVNAKRFDEAIQLLMKTIEQREASPRLGPNHPDTLASRNNLAVAYLRSGRTDEAIRLFQDTLRRRKAALTLDHPHTLETMVHLGLAYDKAGRTKDAIPLLEEALQRGRKLSGGLPNSLAPLPSLLLQAYDRAGQKEKAADLRKKLQETKAAPQKTKP